MLFRLLKKFFRSRFLGFYLFWWVVFGVSLWFLFGYFDFWVSVLVSASFGSFLLFGLDKFQAVRASRALRIPERILFVSAFFGGSPGALLGMWVFRHKVSKTSFKLVIALLIFIQIGFVLFLNSDFYGSVG